MHRGREGSGEAGRRGCGEGGRRGSGDDSEEDELNMTHARSLEVLVPAGKYIYICEVIYYYYYLYYYC